jgi:hypothetical protein
MFDLCFCLTLYDMIDDLILIFVPSFSYYFSGLGFIILARDILSYHLQYFSRMFDSLDSIEESPVPNTPVLINNMS